MHNLFNLCSGWFFPESKFAGTSTTGQTFVLKSWCNLLLEYITPEKLISSLQESVASSECISMHFSIEFHTDWPEFLMKYLVCVFVSVLTFVFVFIFTFVFALVCLHQNAVEYRISILASLHSWSLHVCKKNWPWITHLDKLHLAQYH